MDSTQNQNPARPKSLGEINMIGLREVRLALIKPSLNNPRRVINQEAIDTCAASMKDVGQRTPIKVRNISSQPSVVRGQENENQQDDSYEYDLIGGHIRLEAAKKLGWESIKALVLDLSPQQAALEAVLDNQGKDMHWLDWYQAIESLLKGDPDLNQQQVADRLEVNQATVSRAIKTLKFLNPSAREAIYAWCIKSPGQEINPGAVSCLAELADSIKVEEALKVVLEHQMTAPRAKKLVEWVKAGNDPESYKTGVASAKRARNDNSLDGSKDPNAKLWKDIPPNVRVIHAPKGYEIRFSVAPSEGPAVVYGALANLEHLKGQAGEAENTRYRESLKQIVDEGCNARAAEKTAQAKADGERQSAALSRQLAVEAKAQAKARMAAEKQAAREAALRAKAQKKAELADQKQKSNLKSGTNVEVASTSANDSNKSSAGLLDQMAQAVKDDLRNAPTDIADNLLRDGKGALNSVIRQGMKSVIRGLLSK